MTKSIINTSGFFSLYNGLSAALFRQATYSTVRFSFYEVSKTVLLEKQSNDVSKNSNLKSLPFYMKVALAAIGGGLGSIFGKFYIII